MKVRLPPMKNHMHFRKQSDGHSWLVFTRPATGGRRSIAIIHIPDPHRDPTIELDFAGISYETPITDSSVAS